MGKMGSFNQESGIRKLYVSFAKIRDTSKQNVLRKRITKTRRRNHPLQISQ